MRGNSPIWSRRIDGAHIGRCLGPGRASRWQEAADHLDARQDGPRRAGPGPDGPQFRPGYETPSTHARNSSRPERARRSCQPRLPLRSPEGGNPKFPIGHHPGQVCDRRQMSSLAGAAADVGNCLLPRGRRNSDTHGNVSRRRAETVSDHRANTSTRATKPIPMRATEAAPPNQRAVAVRRSTSAGSSSSSSLSSPRSAPHARRNRAVAAP